VNKSLFRIHSTIALLAFVPLLVICVTGSILVFKHEIDTLLMEETVRVLPQPQQLPLDTLLDKVNREHPGYEAVGWVWYLDPGRADLMYLMEKGTSDWSYVHLDQYTGELLSSPLPHDHFFTDWLLELHFNLLLQDAGLLVTTIFAILLLLLGISGLILHRKFWKNFFTLRWNSRLVVYFSDLHKMVGVIASPILLVLAFTGIWWNVVSLAHEIEEHAGGKEHHVMTARLYGDDVSLDDMLNRAQHEIPGFQATYLTMPWEPGVDFSFWGHVPTSNFLTSEYASVVTFNASTGEHVSSFDIREASLGTVIVDSYRRLHFGDFGGLASKIIWCTIGLMPLALAVTGTTLWWQRRSKRRARQLSLALQS